MLYLLSNFQWPSLEFIGDLDLIPSLFPVIPVNTMIEQYLPGHHFLKEALTHQFCMVPQHSNVFNSSSICHRCDGLLVNKQPRRKFIIISSTDSLVS